MPRVKTFSDRFCISLLAQALKTILAALSSPTNPLVDFTYSKP